MTLDSQHKIHLELRVNYRLAIYQILVASVHNWRVVVIFFNVIFFIVIFWSQDPF